MDFRFPRANLALVLVVERDDSVRRLMEAALRRARFDTHCVSDGAKAAPLDGPFDVVVREAASPEELAGTPADVLLRTVITTTAQWSSTEDVFAVLRKPFDIETLVRVVTECVGTEGVDERLRHFVESVPSLRGALAGPATTPRELLLRSEIRRALSEISSVLHEAAEVERNRSRALGLRAASIAAADLAGGERAVAERTQH